MVRRLAVAEAHGMLQPTAVAEVAEILALDATRALAQEFGRLDLFAA